MKTYTYNAHGTIAEVEADKFTTDYGVLTFYKYGKPPNDDTLVAFLSIAPDRWKGVYEGKMSE